MYPERGPSEYYGILPGASSQMLDWPPGSPRVLAYVYADYRHLPALLAAIARYAGAAIVVCPGIDGGLRAQQGADHVSISETLLDLPRMAEHADLVVSHGSHQTTAEALLKGRPILLLPTQVEQFLTTRRVVRFGAGLGIASDAERPDFDRALAALLETPRYAARAREFATRYGGHDRARALYTLIRRCEQSAAQSPRRRGRQTIHILASFGSTHGAGEPYALTVRDLLAPHADVRLWATEAPRAADPDHAITQVDAERAQFPSGGTLLVAGLHVPMGDWLTRAWYERTILIYDRPADAAYALENARKLQTVSARSETICMPSADAPPDAGALEALRTCCLDAAH
jgi:hypothetical protein